MRRPRPCTLIGWFALCVVGFEFSADRGAVFVDAAECAGDLALELFATRCFATRAAHAAHGGRELLRCVYGHPALRRIVGLSPIKRYAVHGATSATVHAG